MDKRWESLDRQTAGERAIGIAKGEVVVGDGTENPAGDSGGAGDPDRGPNVGVAERGVDTLNHWYKRGGFGAGRQHHDCKIENGRPIVDGAGNATQTGERQRRIWILRHVPTLQGAVEFVTVAGEGRVADAARLREPKGSQHRWRHFVATIAQQGGPLDIDRVAVAFNPGIPWSAWNHAGSAMPQILRKFEATVIVADWAVTRHDGGCNIGDDVEGCRPRRGVALECQRRHAEETKVASEQHVDIFDHHHHIAARVPSTRQHFNAWRQLCGSSDEVRDLATPDLGEFVEPIRELRHEVFVRIDRHVFVVEEVAGLWRPIHRRVGKGA